MSYFFKNSGKIIVSFLLSIIFLIIACKDSYQTSVSPAFYHWKNTLDISHSEIKYLTQVKAEKIYLRFFDVDWEGNAPVPVSILEIKKNIPSDIEIVPTVFITNRTMVNISTDKIPDLVEKIFTKINFLEQVYEKNEIHEIQFDCDWSEKSKAKYFELLQLLKSKFSSKSKRLSATIRLHQIKYFKKTGTPPVDRGTLMFYNMDNINDASTENSIINLELAKQYFQNFDKYPLPLDIALPIFKWGIVFQDDKLVKIINNLDASELQDTSRFIKIDKNRFELAKSTYIKGYYLYQKDQIRLEQVDIKVLKKAAVLLSKIVPKEDRSIIFYHLDSTQIADYPYEEIKDIYSRFY